MKQKLVWKNSDKVKTTSNSLLLFDSKAHWYRTRSHEHCWEPQWWMLRQAGVKCTISHKTPSPFFFFCGGRIFTVAAINIKFKLRYFPQWTEQASELPNPGLSVCEALKWFWTHHQRCNKDNGAHFLYYREVITKTALYKIFYSIHMVLNNGISWLYTQPWEFCIFEQ